MAKLQKNRKKENSFFFFVILHANNAFMTYKSDDSTEHRTQVSLKIIEVASDMFLKKALKR